MSDNKELASLSEEELKIRMDEIRKELIKVRGQAAVGTTQKNPHAIKNNRRAIARILTFLNRKSFEKIVQSHKEGKKKEEKKEEKAKEDKNSKRKDK